MVKVSVVIAVYKAEPYIERCARSLFGQTLRDLEFIFVDDASPDRSIDVMLQTLKDYPERKEQVRIIRHEVNRGVSRTRQDGVDAATGQYIIHCDPDDWVDLNTYELAYNEAQRTGAQFVMFDDYRKPDSAYRHLPEMTEHDNIAMLKKLSGYSGETEFPGMWRNLIDAQFVRRVKFPMGVSNGEDATFLYTLLQYPMKTVHIHRRFYHYESHPESLTHTASRKDLDMDYRNLLIREKLKRGDGSVYDKCIDSGIYGIICVRAFTPGLYTSAEFKERFGRFRHTSKYYRRNSLVSKILVDLSMRGYYRPAYKIYKLLGK